MSLLKRICAAFLPKKWVDLGEEKYFFYKIEGENEILVAKMKVRNANDSSEERWRVIYDGWHFARPREVKVNHRKRFLYGDLPLSREAVESLGVVA